MTVEHRLLFGLADIRAITFECVQCGIRLSIAPDKLKVTDVGKCPTCARQWLHADTNRDAYFYHGLTALVAAIPVAVAWDKEKERGVNISFEFSAPSK